MSVRITPNQSLVLNEMCEALGTSYSMLIRTIIGDWLTTNEEYLYRIIDKKKYGYALGEENRKKEEVFGEEEY